MSGTGEDQSGRDHVIFRIIATELAVETSQSLNRQLPQLLEF
jgi:hypothetical protein